MSSERVETLECTKQIERGILIESSIESDRTNPSDSNEKAE